MRNIQSIDKRKYRKKPQCQINMDWNPFYNNMDITGDMRLDW